MVILDTLDCKEPMGVMGLTFQLQLGQVGNISLHGLNDFLLSSIPTFSTCFCPSAAFWTHLMNHVTYELTKEFHGWEKNWKKNALSYLLST